MDTRALTVAEAALLEYGKQVVLNSADTGRDFHKTMLSVSATFGNLITTVTPVLVWEDATAMIPMPEGWLLIIPPFLMLLSTVTFAMGFFPQYEQFNPNMIDDVRQAREVIIQRRSRLAVNGLILFCGALLILMGLVLWLGTTVTN